MPSYEPSKEEQRKAFARGKKIREASGSQRKPRIRKNRPAGGAMPQPKPRKMQAKPATKYPSNNAAIRSALKKTGTSLGKTANVKVGGPLGLVLGYHEFKRHMDRPKRAKKIYFGEQEI